MPVSHLKFSYKDLEEVKENFFFYPHSVSIEWEYSCLSLTWSKNLYWWTEQSGIRRKVVMGKVPWYVNQQWKGLQQSQWWLLNQLVPWSEKMFFWSFTNKVFFYLHSSFCSSQWKWSKNVHSRWYHKKINFHILPERILNYKSLSHIPRK